MAFFVNKNTVFRRVFWTGFVEEQAKPYGYTECNVKRCCIRQTCMNTNSTFRYVNYTNVSVQVEIIHLF